MLCCDEENIWSPPKCPNNTVRFLCEKIRPQLERKYGNLVNFTPLSYRVRNHGIDNLYMIKLHTAYDDNGHFHVKVMKFHNDHAEVIAILSSERRDSCLYDFRHECFGRNQCSCSSTNN